MKNIFVFVLVIVFLTSCVTIVNPTPTVPPRTYAPPTQPPSTRCIPWQNASAFMNQATCVRGVVYSAYKDPNSNAFFVDFDNTRSSFYAVSFKYSWSNLPGRCVEVYGMISPYSGRPQIILDNASQLSLCESGQIDQVEATPTLAPIKAWVCVDLAYGYARPDTNSPVVFQMSQRDGWSVWVYELNGGWYTVGNGNTPAYMEYVTLCKDPPQLNGTDPEAQRKALEAAHDALQKMLDRANGQ